MATSYKNKRGEEQGDEVRDTLEACVQEETRKMLVAALEEEVTGFLEMLRYSAADSFAATGMVTIRHGR